MQKRKNFKKKNISSRQKSDLLAQPSSSSYMFNEAPVYSEQLESKPIDQSQILKKRKIRDRKKLEKQAELLEYMSSDDDVGQKQVKNNNKAVNGVEEEADYGALEYIDQDIVGYFQVKGQKIIAQSEKIQEPTLSVGTLIFCCVCEIGPNGTYMIVNLNRNKKGFISIDQLKVGHQNAGSYELGEYILCKVISTQDPLTKGPLNKIQMTILPEQVNEGKSFKNIIVGSLLSGIPIQEDDYGYQVKLSDDKYKGFFKIDASVTLIIGRVYIFEVQSKDIKQKLVTLNLLNAKSVQNYELVAKKLSLSQLEPNTIFTPGSLWPIIIEKQLIGGLLVAIPKIGIIGYIFADNEDGINHFKNTKKQLVNARLISFDHHLRNFQFSLRREHIDLTRQETKYKSDIIYNAFRLEKMLYSGSYLITPLRIQQQNEEEQEGKSKKLKKQKKIGDKVGLQQIIIEEGPKAFVHSSNLWITETPDEKLLELFVAELMTEGSIIEKPCRLKEINYFDHLYVATMKPSQLNVQSLSLHTIHAGQFISGIVKSILQATPTSQIRIIVQISQSLSGMIPHQQISDYDENITLNPKIRVGAKIRTRILRVEPKTNSLILTIKPSLMQKDIKILSSLEQINYSDQIYGFISKQIQNGYIVSFFQGVSGLLSLKEIEASVQHLEDIHVGQTIKVYVKYVNSQEGKLLLALRKIDAPEENEIIRLFKEQKQNINALIDSLQLQQLDAQIQTNITGKILNYKIRKNQQYPDQLLILESYEPKNKRKNSTGSLSGDTTKHLAVLLREQSINSNDVQEQSDALHSLIQKQQPIQCSVINNPGVCLVSFKFNTPQAKLQNGAQYQGYIVDVNTRYLLIAIPGIIGCPTGILNLDITKQLMHINYMQTINVVVKHCDTSLVRPKIILELSQRNNNSNQCIQYFSSQSVVVVDDVKTQIKLIGNIVEVKVQQVKEYGLIVQSVGYTGFIMKNNLIEGRDYKDGEKLMAQVIDVDYQKKVLDLRELSEKNLKNEPITIEGRVSGKVILVKDSYCIIKIVGTNKIGFFWTEKSIYKDENNYEIDQLIGNLMCVNNQRMEKSKDVYQGLQKIDYVPLLIQSNNQDNECEEEQKNGVIKLQRSNIRSGQEFKGVIIKFEYNYVNVQLTGGQLGRIHKSQFNVTEDQNRMLGWRSSSQDLNIGDQITCYAIKVPHRFSRGLVQELTTIQQKKHVLMSGKPEEDVGKEIVGVVRLIQNGGLIPVTLEYIGGYVIGLNGWECNLVNQNDAIFLNKIDDRVEVGDVVKVKLVSDRRNKTLGQIIRSQFQAVKPVELYSVQIFRVLSHHGWYVRVQLQNDQFASIDITELSDRWLPAILSQFPKGTWGSCRLYKQDPSHGYWASCRSDFIDQNLWNKCLHPVLSSQLSFNKILQPLIGPFDVRSLYQRNPAYPLTLPIGTLVIGYITSLTQAGAFIRYGASNDCTLLVPIQEISDELNYQNLGIQQGNPAIALITKNNAGRCNGSMRYSLISKNYNQQEPKAGELVEGVITEIKNQRASIKLNGYLLNCELDKKNAEGAEGEEGWWAERLMKVGESIKAIVLSVKELKNGHRIVKLSNVKQLLQENNSGVIINKDGLNQQSIEVYTSMQELVKQYQIENKNSMEVEGQVENNQVQDNEAEAQVQEEEEGEIDQVENDQSVTQDEIEYEDQDQNPESIEQQNQVEQEIDEETLQSRAEFEKQILGNPNSSELWIKFVSYVIEKEGIENARAVMERALRVINFVNEDEKLNLWTAYINLEFHFGSESNLIAVFKKACSSCDRKLVYFRLIDIYRKAEKWDLMVELARSMISKFKSSLKSWKVWIQCLNEWHLYSQQRNKETNQAYQIKDNLQRGMQCMKVQKHAQLLAHYGRIQFLSGQVEQGKTTFDALINKYQKRTDLLGQYIDLSTKYCDIQQTRSLLQRSLDLKLNPHKTKFIFKKWLELEAQYGTTEDVEAIQKKAYDWVQAYKEKQNGQNQNDDVEDEDQ